MPGEWRRKGNAAEPGLLYPAGDYADPEERVRSWATPTSLRNVDAECRGVITGIYALSATWQLIMRGSGTPIRRAQLVSPFGVGAMTTGPDGISVMTAGLDSWFRREGGDDDSANLDPTEFRVEEWRLQRYLNVREFRLPPDYRQSRILISGTAPNTGLTVPMVRFPQIHFCRNGSLRAAHEDTALRKRQEAVPAL